MSGTQTDPLDLTQESQRQRSSNNRSGTKRPINSVEIITLLHDPDLEATQPRKRRRTSGSRIPPSGSASQRPTQEVIDISDDDHDVVFVPSESIYREAFKWSSSKGRSCALSTANVSPPRPDENSTQEVNARNPSLADPVREQDPPAGPSNMDTAESKRSDIPPAKQTVGSRPRVCKSFAAKNARNIFYPGTRVLSYSGQDPINTNGHHEPNRGPTSLEDSQPSTRKTRISVDRANSRPCYAHEDNARGEEDGASKEGCATTAQTDRHSTEGLSFPSVEKQTALSSLSCEPETFGPISKAKQQDPPSNIVLDSPETTGDPKQRTPGNVESKTSSTGSQRHFEPSHHTFSNPVPTRSHFQQIPWTSGAVRSALRECLDDYEKAVDSSTKDLMSRARRFFELSIYNRPLAPNLAPDRSAITPSAVFANENASPFEGMRPIVHSIQARSLPAESSDVKVHNIGAPSKVRNHSFRVGHQLYRDQTMDLEEYTTYTSARDNLLGENDLWLKAWPTAGAKIEQEELETELHGFFEDKIPDERRERLPQVERARQYKYFVADLIRKLGLEIQDVINFLFRSESLNEEFEDTDAQALSQSAKPIPEGSIHRWAESVASSHQPAKHNMITAGRLCAELYKECSIPLWYVVEALLHESGFAPRRDAQSSIPSENYAKMRCSICHLLECPYHGEFFERDESEEDDADPSNMSLNELDNSRINDKWNVNSEPRPPQSDDIPLAYHKGPSPQDFIGSDGGGIVTGIPGCDVEPDSGGYCDHDQCSPKCFWIKSNRCHPDTLPQLWSSKDLEYLKRLLLTYGRVKRGPCMMAVPLGKDCVEVFNMMLTLPPGKSEPLSEPKARKNVSAPWKKDPQRWKSNSLNNRSTFYPCNHKGSCEQAKCECFKQGIVCEKYCRCPPDCERRFTGCACARRGKICWQNPRCPCFALGRECDPDLCGTCGASEILSHVHKHESGISEDRCGNVNLQRNVQKFTRKGRSQVSGWGLYAGEDIQRDEYIGEYRGELLSYGESNRKGEVYQARTRSYQFRLSAENNDKYPQLDGLRLGNKLRFINHASSSKFMNCYPQPILCNTVIRLGMFAYRDIKAGEELFFDYGYTEEHAQGFKEPDGTASIAAAKAASHPNPKFPKKTNLSPDDATSKPRGQNLGKRKARESTTSPPQNSASEFEYDPLLYDHNYTFKLESDPEDDGDYREEEIPESSSMDGNAEPISNEARTRMYKRSRKRIRFSSDD